MGFHISWVGTRGKPTAVVRADFKLKETTDREFVPESDIVGVELPSGWYVVFFNHSLPPELEQNFLSRISQSAEVVACVIEEASMISMAHGYTDGVRVWSVTHDSGEGLTHLDESGVVPEGYTKIRDRLLAESASKGQDADYVFDVPAEICKHITGFRHDEDIQGAVDDPFIVLARV